MKTSNKGIDIIKEFEGCRLKAYKDAVGIPTIGYGHTKGVKMGDTITQAQAEKLLKDDLAAYEKKVDKYNDTYHFNQNQFDALVSFTMNHNEHFWIEYKSSAMKDIRNYVINKKYSKKKTKRIFCQYCYSDGRYSSGLKKRRKREATIFNGGKYRGIDNEVIK